MKRPILLLALLCQAAFSAAYLLRTPVFEAPDEAHHYHYAQQLASGRFPVLRGTSTALGRPIVDENGQAHHPPLYYALVAAVVAAARGQDTISAFQANPAWQPDGSGSALVHLHGFDEARGSREVWTVRMMRLVSLLCGLVTLVLVHRLARAVYPERPLVADAATLLLSCLPLFSFIHGVLNNDTLTATLCHATLLALALQLRRGEPLLRDGLVLGLLAGLALLAKFMAFLLLPLLFATLLLSALRARGAARRRAFGALLLAFLVVLLVTGWFFLRSESLYGDPLAAGAVARAYAENLVPEAQRWSWLLEHMPGAVFRSLAGRLGSHALAPPAWAVGLGASLVVLACAGAVAAWLGVRRARRAGRAFDPLLLLVWAAALLGVLQVFAFNWTYGQPQARFLFPAIGPLAILLCSGLGHLVRLLPRRGGRVLVVAATVAAPLLGLTFLVSHALPGLRFDPAAQGPYYCVLSGGVARTPAAAQIELFEPTDGARLAEPPTFRWRTAAREGRPTSLYILDEDNRVRLALREWLGESAEEGTWTMPQAVWEYMPVEQQLRWKVRVLPDRSRSEEAGDQPESGWFRFTRAALAAGGDDR